MSSITANIGFEKQIWDAACVLRGNIDASEYKNVVLGLIFLKYISDRFDEKHQQLVDEGDGFEEDVDEYISEGIFFVPENARWSVIASKAHTAEIGTVIDDAMRAIEKENKRLKDILPKNFARPELDKRRLGDVVDLFTNIKMVDSGSSRDILGRTYEYCLSKFAEQEGKLAGEFYTPSCVVRTLVEVLQPFNGRVYDPCCGSGGMFVQSAKFIENHSGNISNISVFGQDSNPTTWKMAQMNFLAAYINLSSGVINSNLVGAVQQHFNVGSAKNMKLLLPPIGIQKKIAGIIQSINNKIATNQQINDNLQQQAQALFHAFFPYAPTDNIPTDWRICVLSDVTENIRTRVKNQNCTVLSAVNTGKLQPSEEYFTKRVFSKDISNYIVVEENSFAYNPARVNIGSIGINNLGLLGCVSPVYVVFRVEEDYQYFFDFFIKTPRFREEVKTRASGSVRQAMNYSDFGLIPIAYPPKSVIDNFNHLYLPIYRHMEHRKKENARLAELRDSLLPRLMSGEIDVSDVQF